jgi:hypothetical protein
MTTLFVPIKKENEQIPSRPLKCENPSEHFLPFGERVIWRWERYLSFCGLFFCVACAAEPVSLEPKESHITASGVELELTMGDGALLAKGEKLIAGNGNRRMRLKGDVSVTFKNNAAGGVSDLLRPVFSARANQIEIDTDNSIMELKGDVRARFAGYARIDGDAGF